MNKRLFLPLFFYFFLSKLLVAQKIQIFGVSSLNPLLNKWATTYKKETPKFLADVYAEDAKENVKDCIDVLISDKAHLALTTRLLKEEEKQMLLQSGLAIVEIPVAMDALVIALNKGNNINVLTIEDIQDIYAKRISNWSELGGANMSIMAYAKEPHSDSYELFKDRIFKTRDYLVINCVALSSNAEIKDRVNSFRSAVAVVAMSNIGLNAKHVDISVDLGKKTTSPTIASIKSKQYPLYRTLYFIYLSKTERLVKPFVDFVVSPQGQRLALEMGYVPVF